MTTASATAITMPANCPCDRTASAPCSMVSLILSCFSSLREICSATPTLLNGFEYAIVAQDSTRTRIRQPVPMHLKQMARIPSPTAALARDGLLFRQKGDEQSPQPFER